MSGGAWVLVIGFFVLAIGGGFALTGSGSNDPLVLALAQAIATAEGFYVAGSTPQVRNNPGDIEDSSGNIQTFSTPEDGWNALYSQISAMLYGGSAYYNPSMTFAQVGAIYSNGDPNWANNVASSLGVSTDTTLQQWMQQQQGA